LRYRFAGPLITGVFIALKPVEFFVIILRSKDRSCETCAAIVRSLIITTAEAARSESHVHVSYADGRSAYFTAPP
jgi:hypothetical protein